MVCFDTPCLIDTTKLTLWIYIPGIPYSTKPFLAGVGDSQDGTQRSRTQGSYQDCGRPSRAVLRPHIHAGELRGTSRRFKVNVFFCNVRKPNWNVEYWNSSLKGATHSGMRRQVSAHRRCGNIDIHLGNRRGLATKTRIPRFQNNWCHHKRTQSCWALFDIFWAQ